MNDAKRADKLRSLNRSSSRLWEIQTSLSEEYREAATSPEEALQADELAKADAARLRRSYGSQHSHRLAPPAKRGRRQTPADVANARKGRVMELRADGRTWNEIANILNSENPRDTRSADSYRKSLTK